MNHDQHKNGSAPNLTSEPFDASDDAFDMYIANLFNEGRDLFARLFPVDEGLTAIIGATDNAADNATEQPTFGYPDDSPESEGWYKSSMSEGVDACVEIRFGDKDVQVRDSKNLRGPRLGLPGHSWERFVTHIKSDSA